MLTGTRACKLCLKFKPLRDSHLLPRRVYSLLRAPGLQNSDPLFMNTRMRMQTSRQVKHHVLCAECEQLLNREGETWVLPNLARDSSFRLLEVIEKCEPVFQDEGWSVVDAAKIPQIGATKLTHYGAGIFWKASVHDWLVFNEKTRIYLGKYSDQLRRYLLGDEFPQHMGLHVTVAHEKNPIRAAHPPVEAIESKYHMYMFYVPGIVFTLAVGKQVPDYFLRSAISSREWKPILLRTDVSQSVRSNMRPLWASSKPSRKLQTLLGRAIK